MFKKQRKKGITLVALVVTIIILLILAGVTIAIVIGPNGLIQRARASKVASYQALIRDKTDLWRAGNELAKKMNEPETSFNSFLDKLIEEGLITSEESTLILNNPRNELEVDGIKVGFNEPYGYIKPGDIIYYDPTKGADPTKLTYTSEKGSSKAAGDAENAPGNGYGEQIFEATSTDNKWVVLYNEKGQLTLMSEDLKNPISGGLDNAYTLNGSTAYLYAEQELHNICSIYGHR